MASESSATSSPPQRSTSDASGEMTRQQLYSFQHAQWTEARETELQELKAKLKAAHKSWSSEQELYHERHDYLEEKKRKAMKAGKKAAKLAKKESEEGKEGTGKISNLLRRVSTSLGGSSGCRSRSNSESRATDAAPLARTGTGASIASRLRSFSFSSRGDANKDK
ncbi:MAG: hypothetical protein HETSPECPRED_004842 [Heterodermia speciosa]|uniref:Uncharacterized protein n=1 Tax=Heterodermia speciosa TaxID=116794 RepID=A0A8H3ED95_9LECA|nr:MAG: hypothetical protein HETSPECPRED_004842 [Heterodermia speciosa]